MSLRSAIHLALFGGAPPNLSVIGVPAVAKARTWLAPRTDIKLKVDPR
jgi:hypothetical protein